MTTVNSITCKIVDKTKNKLTELEGANNKFSKIMSKVMQGNLKTLVDFDKIKGIIESTKIIPTDASLEFYTSAITSCNWYDEFEEGSCIGILVNITTDPLTEIGFKKNYFVSNVSTIFYSASDYMNRLDELAQCEEDYCKINTQTVISGTIVGDNNCLIPLYINKYHWKIAKIYMKPLIGISVSHNPLGFIPKSLNVVYNILCYMCKQLIKDPKMNNQSYIGTFIALYRTASQISFDEQYNRGMSKYIESYVKDKDNIKDNIVSIIGQCLSINYGSQHLVELLYHYINHYAVFIDATSISIMQKRRNEAEIDEEITEMLEKLEMNIPTFETVITSLLCQQILDKLITDNFTNYSTFIKEMEQSSTILSESIHNKLKSLINTGRTKLLYSDGKMQIDNLKVVCPSINLNYVIYIIVSTRLKKYLDKPKESITKHDIYKLFN